MTLHGTFPQNQAGKHGEALGCFHAPSVSRTNIGLFSGLLASVLCTVFLITACLRSGGILKSRRLAAGGNPDEGEDVCRSQKKRRSFSVGVELSVDDLFSRLSLGSWRRSSGPEEEIVTSAVDCWKKAHKRSKRTLAAVVENKKVTITVEVAGNGNGNKAERKKVREELKAQIRHLINADSNPAPIEIYGTGGDGTVQAVFSVRVEVLLSPHARLVDEYSRKIGMELQRFQLEAQRRRQERSQRTQSASSESSSRTLGKEGDVSPHRL